MIELNISINHKYQPFSMAVNRAMCECLEGVLKNKPFIFKVLYVTSELGPSVNGGGKGCGAKTMDKISLATRHACALVRNRCHDQIVGSVRV